MPLGHSLTWQRFFDKMITEDLLQNEELRAAYAGSKEASCSVQVCFYFILRVYF